MTSCALRARLVRALSGGDRVLSLITGVGARGQVGEAVAAALARRGDKVILVSRNAAEVHDRAEELMGAGYPAHGYPCDLADAGAVAELAARVRAEHGTALDNLVNLAGGFGLTGPVSESDPAEFARMVTINLTTAFNATRAFLPMIRHTGGSIVYFASENALDGVRAKGTAAYTVAKSAVVALMRSVSDEGRDAGFRANALAPAAIRTATNESSMGAGARFIEREDVAATVAFLCSAASRAINGQVIRLR